MASNNLMLKPIKSSDGEVTCLSFHPEKDVISYGTIEGVLKLCSYSIDNEPHELMNFSHHKKSCRSLSYYSDGSHIISASADKSFALIDLDEGVLIHRFKKAHECAIYSSLVVNRNIVATGDDDGCIKLWDTRHYKTIMEMTEHDDCITDIITDDKNNLMLCTSGDGTLSVFDVRKHKMKMQSELMNAGLQSLAIIKNGEKVVCGSEDGVLNFFNWNEWGNISDRFPGHPMSIEKIVPLAPQLICTAASDAIRAVSLFPNRIIDIVGDHGGSPIESLSLSHCKTWLASCSHDQHIRFWDVSDINVDGKLKKNIKRMNLKGKRNKFSTKSEMSKRENFFADLVEDIKESSSKKEDASDNKDDDDDDDDDDSSDDSDNSEGEMKNKKKLKKFSKVNGKKKDDDKEVDDDENDEEDVNDHEDKCDKGESNDDDDDDDDDDDNDDDDDDDDNNSDSNNEINRKPPKKKLKQSQ